MRYNGPTAAVRDQFHQGTNRRAYEMLGAHPVTQDGQEMWHFAVWAPNARAVSLIGEFNQWDRKKTPMQKVYDGTWEVRLPAKTFDVKSDPKRYDYPDAAKKLTTYKYCIQAQDGTWQDKADPYGFAMQMRPDTASRIYDLSGYRWGDADWMEARKSYDPYHSPVNIYEMHLGSWRRHKDGTFLTYTEIAEQLVPYLKEMGYTHVEFMPVMEHPLDMSWGYQVSGYYAATARFGEPKELMALIDALHQAGIGVLLDWDALNVIDLSDHLRDGENDVMLFKRQDSCYKMTLHALLIGENATLLPPPARPNRRIEFYGDSVSAGEVSEVTEYAGKIDPPDHQARYNNVWFSYAWQTARLLNAEISDIAQGGIALQDGNGYFFDTGMLSCWDKLAYNPFFHDEKPWDFSRFTPHVVVVAIGQNDSAKRNFMAEDYDGEQAKRWRSDYAGWIRAIRGKYPHAHILLTTTIMAHSPAWDDAIEEVFGELGDEKVHHFLYPKNGCGTPGHVRANEAAEMAKALAAYIEAIPNVWQEDAE